MSETEAGPIHFTAVDFTACVRPTKIAFLIRDTTPVTWINDVLIPWLSTTWGGLCTAVIPVSESLDANPKFNEWRKLLQKYDPDQVFSADQFPPDFIEKIGGSVLTKSDVFQYNTSVGGFPRIFQRGQFYTLGLEEVFSTASQAYQIAEYGLTGNAIHDLWFFSQYGRCNNSLPPSQNITQIAGGPLTAANIESNAEQILERKFPNSFQGSPLLGTMEHLWGAYAPSFQTEYFIPRIIVVGDSVADWALFQTLQGFSTGTSWLPPALFQVGAAGTMPSLEYVVHGTLSESSRQAMPIVTSASLDAAAIDTYINSCLGRVSAIHPTFQRPTFSIRTDFGSALQYWLEWTEKNNFREATTIFQGDRSVQKVPTSKPKNFSLQPSNAKFKVNLDAQLFRFLGHHLTDSVPVQWDSKSSKRSAAKRNFTGGISFEPTRAAYMTGHDLETVLNGPRILRSSIFDDFTEIGRTVGLRPARSIKTMNVASVLEMWNRSTESFCEDYFRKDTSRIFESFKLGVKARVSGSVGLAQHYGLGIRNKIFFSQPLAGCFVPPLTSMNNDLLDLWLRQRILLRGERLTCRKCGWIDFYDANETTTQFQCHRCRTIQPHDQRSMGAVEPRFLYGLNPLIYGLQESDSDLVVLGIESLRKSSEYYFEWETEIELFNAEGRNIQEIDILANVDGRLFIGECKTNGKLNGVQLQSYVKLCRQCSVDTFVCVAKGVWTNPAKTTIQNAFASQNTTELRFIDAQ